MPVLTEPPSMGDVLKYEVNPNYTREVVTLLAGLPYPVGSVLGKITASGKYTLSAAAAGDGSEVPDAILAEDCDAAAGDRAAVAYTRGDFNEAALTFGAGHTAASTREGLRNKGLYLVKVQA